MQMQYGISSILQGTIHASVDSKSMNLLLPACLILGLYGPYRAGRILIRNREALSLPGSKFDSRPLPWASYLLALAIALAAIAVLFLRKDIHGVAGLAGIALALVLLRPAVAQRSLGEL
jgi:hypothetical protein